MNRPTLLILDDDTILLEILGRALRRDYRVLLAETAEEAFRFLATTAVDIVISDHHMPGMTGLEFLKQVATRHEYVLRILFTAQPDVAMVIAAINQGDVYRVLVKPLALQELDVVLGLAVQKLLVDRENRILRSIVGRSPELDLEFQQLLESCFGPPDEPEEAGEVERPAATTP